MTTLAEIAALLPEAEERIRLARRQVKELLRNVEGGTEVLVDLESAEREVAILHKLQLELISSGKTTPTQAQS